MHLLVVDDSQDGAELMADLLRTCSSVDSVEVAYDGQDGVDKARAHLPDMVVLDIEMPRLSGVDAAMAIRLAEPSRRPYLVAMTGKPDSLHAAIASGTFDCVLGKPVPWSALADVLEQAKRRHK
jgi:CheY-like chemotaxis protein